MRSFDRAYSNRYRDIRCEWCSTQFLHNHDLKNHAEQTTQTYLKVNSDGVPWTFNNSKICVAPLYKFASQDKENEEEEEDVGDNPWFEDEPTKISLGKSLPLHAPSDPHEQLTAHRFKGARSNSNEYQNMSAPGSPDELNELYSSGVPRSSFLGSRDHPLRRLEEHRKAQLSVTSSQGYGTAQSSLASYVTATSGSRTASGTSTGHAIKRIGESATRSQARTTIFLTWPEIVNKIVTQVQWTFFPMARLPPDFDMEAFRSYVSEVTLPFSLPHSSTQYDVASPDEVINRILAFMMPFLGTLPPEDMARKQNIFRAGMLTKLRQHTIIHDGRYKTNVGKAFTSEWLNYLDARGILLDPKDELDWSGRGQHVEYETTEESSIPLSTDSILGYSASAIVDSVKCRRIMLARKKIRCRGRLTKREAIKEVEHLQQLQHMHIVRVVGTYTCGKDLAILIYPAARWNLEEYLESIEDEGKRLKTDVTRDLLLPWIQGNRRKALLQFVGCLSHAMAFIHGKNIKHMDIKPSNCLIQQQDALQYRIYIADFGIARAYKSHEESETDSPMSFTRTYAAPEVVLQETRGFSADIFSLGCVYVETLATIFDERHVLHDKRLARADTTYQANTIAVTEWCKRTLPNPRYKCHNTGEVIQIPRHIIHRIVEMLHLDPSARPSAQTLKEETAYLSCTKCDAGPEPFKAAH
ncbi:hypothetical protein NX059_011597 [Plenodomus lindquistii]|nr:hypothetical protein NX059_011597 [Plenodomus lindquistii]